MASNPSEKNRQNKWILPLNIPIIKVKVKDLRESITIS